MIGVSALPQLTNYIFTTNSMQNIASTHLFSLDIANYIFSSPLLGAAAAGAAADVGVWLIGLIGVAVAGLATFCAPEMPVVCKGAVCFLSVGDAALFAA